MPDPIPIPEIPCDIARYEAIFRDYVNTPQTLARDVDYYACNRGWFRKLARAVKARQFDEARAQLRELSTEGRLAGVGFGHIPLAELMAALVESSEYLESAAGTPA